MRHGNLDHFDFSNNGGINRKRQIDFPDVVFESKPGMSEDDKKCSICLEDFENGTKIKFLACMHRYHSECISMWVCIKIFL
jgi:hypothetical protein